MTTIKIKRLDHNRDLDLPSYETVSSAGMDLRAAINEDLVLKVGDRQLIKMRGGMINGHIL